jgi:hypothetical protein
MRHGGDDSVNPPGSDICIERTGGLATRLTVVVLTPTVSVVIMWVLVRFVCGLARSGTSASSGNNSVVDCGIRELP